MGLCCADRAAGSGVWKEGNPPVCLQEPGPGQGEQPPDLIDIQECKSVASNMFIKNQIEMKLLPLHKDKCKKIHIGQEFELCPILKVHDDDSDIKLVTEDKFLVDIVSNDIPPQTDVLCMTTSGLYGLFSHM